MKIDKTTLLEHVNAANESRVLELLARVYTWIVNLHDPTQIQRQQNAQTYITRILLAGTERVQRVEEGREFLRSLTDYSQDLTRDWLEK